MWVVSKTRMDFMKIFSIITCRRRWLISWYYNILEFEKVEEVSSVDASVCKVQVQVYLSMWNYGLCHTEYIIKRDKQTWKNEADVEYNTTCKIRIFRISTTTQKVWSASTNCSSGNNKINISINCPSIRAGRYLLFPCSEDGNDCGGWMRACICGSCQKKGPESLDAEVECSQQRQDSPSSPPLYVFSSAYVHHFSQCSLGVDIQASKPGGEGTFQDRFFVGLFAISDMHQPIPCYRNNNTTSSPTSVSLPSAAVRSWVGRDSTSATLPVQQKVSTIPTVCVFSRFSLYPTLTWLSRYKVIWFFCKNWTVLIYLKTSSWSSVMFISLPFLMPLLRSH